MLVDLDHRHRAKFLSLISESHSPREGGQEGIDLILQVNPSRLELK